MVTGLACSSQAGLSARADDLRGGKARAPAAAATDRHVTKVADTDDHPKRCRTSLGSLVHHDSAGRNAVHVSKVGGVPLKPGRYRVTARPTAYGLRGNLRKARFRVLK